MIPHRGGLPHSDIHGSTPARGSPWLFAACHVLHRLLVPRHPPNALITLDNHEPILAGRNLRRSVLPTMHRSHPHPTARRGMNPPNHTARQYSAYTRGTHRHHDRQITTTPLNVVAFGRGQPDPERSAYRSDLRPQTRPETHQNLIHNSKEQNRRPANRTPNGTITPGPRMRCLRQFPEHVTFSVTTHQQPPTALPSASTPPQASLPGIWWR